ncbi:MAG TPA: hypothetical protein VEY33_13590 [Gemmatimonadota bacterium]|nr:hypothetical protein [Gemmatimonadota bacterium]
MTAPVELPLLDEHSVRTSADPTRVWDAIPEGIAAAFDHGRGRALAGLLGCRERRAAQPFAAVEGATIPGFRAVRVRAPREIALEGSHHFASYVLTFLVEPQDWGTTLRAVTHAAFPGVRGTLYRALVVGSGGHRLVTRRILKSIARRAERAHTHRTSEEGA